MLRLRLCNVIEDAYTSVWRPSCLPCYHHRVDLLTSKVHSPTTLSVSYIPNEFNNNHLIAVPGLVWISWFHHFSSLIWKKEIHVSRCHTIYKYVNTYNYNFLCPKTDSALYPCQQVDIPSTFSTLIPSTPHTSFFHFHWNYMHGETNVSEPIYAT